MHLPTFDVSAGKRDPSADVWRVGAVHEVVAPPSPRWLPLWPALTVVFAAKTVGLVMQFSPCVYHLIFAANFHVIHSTLLGTAPPGKKNNDMQSKKSKNNI